MRQTEPDMLQGVEHGTESQLVETGDATEEDPKNLGKGGHLSDLGPG